MRRGYLSVKRDMGSSHSIICVVCGRVPDVFALSKSAYLLESHREGWRYTVRGVVCHECLAREPLALA